MAKISGIGLVIVFLLVVAGGVYDIAPGSPEGRQAFATPIVEFAAIPEQVPGGNIQSQPTRTIAPVTITHSGIWVWDADTLTGWTDQWGNRQYPEYGDRPVGCDALGPSDPNHPDWPPYCSAGALQLAIANGYVVAGTVEVTQVTEVSAQPPAQPLVQPPETPSGSGNNFWAYLIGVAIIVMILRFLSKIVTAANMTGTSHEVHTIKDPANPGDWQECGHQHGFLWGLFHWNGSQVDARTPTGDVKGWSSAEKRWTTHLNGMGCALVVGLVVGAILISTILGR